LTGVIAISREAPRKWADKNDALTELREEGRRVTGPVSRETSDQAGAQAEVSRVRTDSDGSLKDRSPSDDYELPARFRNCRAHPQRQSESHQVQQPQAELEDRHGPKPDTLDKFAN